MRNGTERDRVTAALHLCRGDVRHEQDHDEPDEDDREQRGADEVDRSGIHAVSLQCRAVVDQAPGQAAP